MKLQLFREIYTTFYTGRIQSCCYLALKKNLIYSKYVCLFMYSYLSRLGVIYRHKLKHSLVAVPRKMVLLKF